MTTSPTRGPSLAELADGFGTPLFVYDGDGIATAFRRLRAGLDPAVELLYSLKANPCLAVCALLTSLGAGAEVSSLGEYATARAAGVDPANVVYPGPGKSDQEHAVCIEHGVGALVCESWQELDLVDAAASAQGRRAQVLVRVNPDFSLRTHTLAMGGRARQFGIDAEQIRAFGRDRLAALRNTDVLGMHVYMGTRLLDDRLVVDTFTRAVALAGSLWEDLGLPLRMVDIGGGFGVPYFAGEEPLNEPRLLDGINAAVATFREAHPGTRLAIELGRYLVAPWGTYVTTVRYTKESQGERFAVTDGGTHHHMAAVGIGSFVHRDFPLFLVDGEHRGPTSAWNVSGVLCTPNDLLGRRTELPDVTRGDRIGIAMSGAYGPSASPGWFLGHGFPAEVLVHEGRAHLVRTRDDTSAGPPAQVLPEPLTRSADRTPHPDRHP